nr:hypothetical protein [Methylobacterium tarhaniae]
MNGVPRPGMGVLESKHVPQGRGVAGPLQPAAGRAVSDDVGQAD